MKEIPLYYKNKIFVHALVDDEDFEWLSKYKWRGFCKKKIKHYAITTICSNDGWRKEIAMHRMIFEKYNQTSKNDLIDHEDTNSLNNQKSNLRIATYSQNMWNKSKTLTKSTSQYKGVSFKENHKSWMASVCINRKTLCLGYFKIEKDAAITYDIKAKELFGKFGRLNFANGEIDNDKIQDISNRINRNKVVSDTSSKYIGVTKFRSGYNAGYRLNGRWKTIGSFNLEEDAALARDYYILHFYTDKHLNKLNFPNATKEDYKRIRMVILEKRKNKTFSFEDELCK